MVTFFIRDLPPAIFESQVMQYAKELSAFVDGLTIVTTQRLIDNHPESGIDLVDIDNKKQVSAILKQSRIVYIRDIKSYFYYYLNYFHIKKPSVLYDFRGLISAESFLRNKSKLRLHVLEKIESFIFKRAKYVSCVSENMKTYLLEKYKNRDNVFVLPCCVSSNYKRENPENYSGLNFVYVGGLSKWQCFDKMLTLYKKIQEKLPEAYLTVITKQEEQANEMIAVSGIDTTRVLVKSMKQNEVLEKLETMDFGFLLREDVLLNNVASPIKFVEYISRGVIPVISEGVGDYSSIIKENKLGIVLDDNCEPDYELLSRLKGDRLVGDKIFNLSQSYLWSAALQNSNILNAYRQK